MMKWLFGLLLLANLVFFAFMQWGGALIEDNRNLQLQQAFNAEKIKLQTASSVAPAPVVPASAAQSSVTSGPSVPALPLPVAQSSVKALTTDVCLEWGEFSGNDFTRASTTLSGLNLGDKLTQRQIEHVSGYWVYIPPLKTRAEADRKVGQLKARGVMEYFVVNEVGIWQNAISLGIFKTEEAAQKHLGSLAAKGVISAKVGERTSKLTFTIFELKNLDAGMADKVRALQKEFPGSEVKTLACN
jgi:hypothetical protein